MDTTVKLETGDRELVVTRVLNAPRELVFEAWTNPEHIGHWWGPNGFTLTTKEWNLKTGGIWRFTMHGPDGTDYPNKIIFLEIVKPERLVYKHDNEKETEPINFHVTITFEASGNKTKLEMRSLFETKEELTHVAEKYGAIEGAREHVSRLEEYLLQLQHASRSN